MRYSPHAQRPQPTRRQCSARAMRCVAAALVLVLAGCAQTDEPVGGSTAPSVVTDNPATQPLAYLDCDFSDHAPAVLEAVWQVKTPSGHGTAFHVGDGQWLTAEHVISGRGTVTLHNSGSSITATVAGSTTAGDTALLVTSSAPRSLEFGSLADIGPGHQTYAVGFPLYDAPQASISRGILSRVERHTGLDDVILTDAASNPGNSGGPLLNECGQMVGMIVSGHEDAEGLNYAVAETTLRRRIADFGGSVPDGSGVPDAAPSVSAPPVTTTRPQPTTTRAPRPANEQPDGWTLLAVADGAAIYVAVLAVFHPGQPDAAGLFLWMICDTYNGRSSTTQIDFGGRRVGSDGEPVTVKLWVRGLDGDTAPGYASGTIVESNGFWAVDMPGSTFFDNWVPLLGERAAITPVAELHADVLHGDGTHAASMFWPVADITDVFSAAVAEPPCEE